MAFTIRPAESGDEPVIAEIAEGVALFPASALPGMIAPSLHGEAPDIWLVAERDGEVVGFSFCEQEAFTDGVWNMRSIGVTPRAQRSGVGSALMSALETALKDRPSRLLVVETSDAPDQAAAREFYAAHGCEREAEIREFWGEGIAKVIYSKRLIKGR